jgi:hypothetical protein
MRNQNLASTFFLAFCLRVVVAHAGPLLDLTLINPNPVVTQGTTAVAFEAMILNPSTTQTVYLNGDNSATSSSFLAVNDSPFFANAPFSLAPGQSSGPLELFEVDLAPDTSLGAYTLNTFSILGGADGGTLSDFADIADAGFSVTVTSAMASVPEPGPLLLALTGLLIAGWKLAMDTRRRG